MIVKLLTEHNLKFLSLKESCRGSSEPTLVKMSDCWKSHAAAHYHYIILMKPLSYLGFLSVRPYFRQACPTVGVYIIGIISSTFCVIVR